MSCNKSITNSKKSSLKELIILYKQSLDSQGCLSPLYLDLNEVVDIKKKETTEIFLQRCVCNRKRHQYCLSNVAVDKAVSKLLTFQNIWSPRSNNFEELYDTIFNLIGKGKTGISYSTVYDTAIRIGWTFSPKIVPEEMVYVHLKLIKSAKCIFKNKLIIKDHCRIERDLFNKREPEFKKLSSLEIEDFLCVCHDELLKI